ncbi:MAG: phage major capsid protein [Salinarimonadaceae bacterium]|nr:MAG: phage major capsid protein [Salinarimonadaceae bacterium]
MNRLAELREARAAKVAEMRALLDAANKEKRDLSDGESTRFEALKAEVSSIETRIGQAEALAEMERRAEAEPVNGNEHSPRELRNYSLARAMHGMLNGRLDGVEREAHDELARGREARGLMVPTSILLGEQRALTTTAPVGGPGGNIVATNLAPLGDRFRPALRIESMGATILRNLTGNLDLPNLAESGAAFWVAEHVNTTGSDPEFRKTSMSPKTVSGQYEVSRRMLLQAAPALDEVLRRDLGFILAQALDKAAISGGGANEPSGILSTVGVAEITDAAALSDTAADLIGALDLDDVTGTRAFLTSPVLMNRARKIKDLEGRNIPLSEIFHNERVESSTQVPADLGEEDDLVALIYGEWAHLYLGYWSGIDILLNPYDQRVSSKGGVLMQAFLDTDVAVRDVRAFRYAEVAAADPVIGGD